MSVSRVRENRMHGSKRRREAHQTSRPYRADLAASRRPYTTGVVRQAQSRAGVFETGVVCGLLSAFDRLARPIRLGAPADACPILTRNFGRRRLCDSLRAKREPGGGGGSAVLRRQAGKSGR